VAVDSELLILRTYGQRVAPSCDNLIIAQIAQIVQVHDALGDALEAVRLHAPAGSAVLYDVSLFHGRSAGGDARTLRRTMHQYYGRLSGAPNVPWVLLPKRLHEAPDPGAARFS
jgi:hypothetical protein